MTNTARTRGPVRTAGLARRRSLARRSGRTTRRGGADLLGGVLVAAVALRLLAAGWLDRPAVGAWATVFVAVCVQSAPFLVLGAAVSGGIGALVTPGAVRRVVPARPAFAVPVAALAGAALPGCECASVPVAAALQRRGVAPSAAVAFLLSAPATNPVVLVATAVAFRGQPAVVLARLLASLLTAVVVGWTWIRCGRSVPPPRAGPHGGSLRAVFLHDALHGLGLIVLGAAAAATLTVCVPTGWLAAAAHGRVVGVVVLAALAVLLAVCSEADAFVAASLTQFSLSARLAFMVVGPAVDVKLVAMHVGCFGRRFATRLAPLAWLTAVGSAALFGAVLL